MADTALARLRLAFEGRHILCNSNKKEGLNRSWVLVKTYHKTISDLASSLIQTFRLHRTCPDGIIFSMDGFVLPHFESTCILKDKDVLSVTKKGSISAHNAAGELASAPHCSTLELKHVDNVHQGEEFRGFLTDEEFKIETGGYQSESEMDDNDQFEDTLLVESTPEAVSKKRKASKKLQGTKKKKSKLSTSEEPLIPQAPAEENGSFAHGSIHPQLSLIKDKSSGKPDKSSTQKGHDQINKDSRSMANTMRQDTFLILGLMIGFAIIPIKD